MAKLSKLYTRKEINAMRKQLADWHGDKCAVCGKPGKAFKRKLSVDHNHATNAVRGLLCFRCNKFLVGRHTIESARQVLDYLLQYDKEVSC